MSNPSVCPETSNHVVAGTGVRSAKYDENTSYNFEIAKVASIIMVAIGHFSAGFNLWMLVTVGLFIFGSSSAFFTASIHDSPFSFARFWRKKLLRLAPSLLVVNTFLLAIFIWQDRPGIVTWQTVLNLFGLTGLLDWLHLSNPSPFGTGLWFFTLLLIFYATYPLLRLLSHSHVMLAVVACVSLGACWLLQYAVPMVHMLWITAWSFVFGLVVHRFNPSLPTFLSGVLAVTMALLMVALNAVWGVSQLNLFLLIGVSAFTVLWLKEARLPRRLLSPLGLFSGCVLEIYFLHSYLFIRPSRIVALNLIMSLAVILSVSLLLGAVAARIRTSGGARRYLAIGNVSRYPQNEQTLR